MLYILLSAAISIWFHLYILFEFFPIIKNNSLKMNMHLLCLSEEAVLCLCEVFLFLILIWYLFFEVIHHFSQ